MTDKTTINAVLFLLTFVSRRLQSFTDKAAEKETIQIAESTKMERVIKTLVNQYRS